MDSNARKRAVMDFVTLVSMQGQIKGKAKDILRQMPPYRSQNRQGGKIRSTSANTRLSRIIGLTNKLGLVRMHDQNGISVTEYDPDLDISFTNNHYKHMEFAANRLSVIDIDAVESGDNGIAKEFLSLGQHQIDEILDNYAGRVEGKVEQFCDRVDNLANILGQVKQFDQQLSTILETVNSFTGKMESEYRTILDRHTRMVEVIDSVNTRIGELEQYSKTLTVEVKAVVDSLLERTVVINETVGRIVNRLNKGVFSWIFGGKDEL